VESTRFGEAQLAQSKSKATYEADMRMIMAGADRAQAQQRAECNERQCESDASRQQARRAEQAQRAGKAEQQRAAKEARVRRELGYPVRQ
jgi:hypothetical protein